MRTSRCPTKGVWRGLSVYRIDQYDRAFQETMMLQALGHSILQRKDIYYIYTGYRIGASKRSGWTHAHLKIANS